jgi:hypothetical protein
MKQRLISTILLCCLIIGAGFNSFAEPVDQATAYKTAVNKICVLEHSIDFTVVSNGKLFYDPSGQPLFYFFGLEPSGFIVTSADNDLPPVISYSFSDNAGVLDDRNNLLIQLLIADLTNRRSNIGRIPQEVIMERNREWEELKAGKAVERSGKFQQWPPEGTTPTGGWLEANWHQSPPYNNLCPMDPVTNQRSVAGCPATAMAQIVNYFETINGTFFTDDDDYYHAYAGRNYWIDDDYIEIDFPSFPQLNAHLDTIASCYANGGVLKDIDKAALTFACGVAAHQVYTSQVSGTFGVNQALQAYQKFGFAEVAFFDENDTSVYNALAQNMMEARPAHLAVVDPGWTMGHNVVVDGYNTDDYYHLNFGWGGPYNGWYLLPDEIPYGLTVIEGAIADIAYPPVNTGFAGWTDPSAFEIYPNPATERVIIEFCSDRISECYIELSGMNGSKVFRQEIAVMPGTKSIPLELRNSSGGTLQPGVYLCRLVANDRILTRKITVRQ